jgi:hypothetical protein
MDGRHQSRRHQGRISITAAGEVFGEQVVYDPETGQLLTATFMDSLASAAAGAYWSRRAADVTTASRIFFICAAR